MADSNLVTSLANSNFNYNNESALNMRLSTEDLLYRLELNLKGIKLVPKRHNESGVMEYEEVKIGDAKMNDIGIQSVMLYVTSLINTATVQGNWDDTRYRIFLYRTRRDLAIQITVCSNYWSIKDYYLEFVCDLIMNTFEAFLSRLIGNKERESYSNTVSVKEVNTVNQGQGMKV